MAEFQNQFARKGVELVAISVDPIEESVTLANKLGVSFPLLSDPGLKAALAYGVAMKGDEIAVPSVFLIDQNKTIVFEHVGETVTDRPSAGELLEQASELTKK